MDAQSAISLCQNALWCALTLCAPILLAGIVVGLGIGLLQALTQIQEQTMVLVFKLLAMAVAIAWFFPWMIARLSEFFQMVIENIPDSIHPVM